MTLRIQTLGGLEITYDGQPLSGLKTRKAQALLVYLVCHQGQRFSREFLQGLLWADSDKKRAAASLRQVLSGLGKALPDGILLLDGLEVAFAGAGDCWLDLAELDAQPERYTGEFLNGFVVNDAPLWEEWLYSERESIRLAVLENLLGRGEAAAADDPAAAIPFYQQALGLEPWRESSHRALMHLYWRNGDRAAALRQYDECCRALAVELDVEPSSETAALAARIQSGEELYAHNLPHPDGLTSFVGRDEEVAQIGVLLAQYRMVTLIGLGGTGKTRLAIEAGRTSLARFPDGIFLVDLVGVQSGQMVQHLADTLAVPLTGTSPPAQQLSEHLGDRQRLLILDNFEPLLTDSSALACVRTLLAGNPRLRLLVTSRQRLNLRQEHTFLVEGLSESTQGNSISPAVQLFCQRARQVDRDFAPDGENLAAAARICTLVESMPLAIEMAASWMRLLDAQTIAGEIERDLAFLQSTQHDRPDRHQRLEAVFDHAWGMLTAPEQEILQSLVFFLPGFDAEAARSVTQASLPQLLSLADSSLLQRMDRQRFRLHERLRQYVAEKRTTAAQRRAVLDAHARYYLGWLAGRKEAITGPQQAVVMEAIDQASENIRAAWSWASQHALAGLLYEAAAPLHTYQTTRSRFWEAEAMAKEALHGLTGGAAGYGATHKSAVARLLISLGGAERRLGRMADAETRTQQAIRLAQEARDEKIYALGLTSLGNLFLEMGRNGEALELLGKAIEWYGRVDDLPNEMLACNSLGVIHKALGDNASAREAYERCRALALRVGHQRALAYTINNLGVVADEDGDPVLALTYFQEALTGFQTLGEARMIGMVSSNIGNIFLDRKELVQAEKWYQSGLQAIADTGEQSVRALLLLGLGSCLRSQARWDEAEQVLAQSLAISRGLKDPAQEAFAETYLARVASERGDAAQAQRRLYRAFTVAADSPTVLLEALAEWAIVAIDLLGERATALPWLLIVVNHPAADYDVQARMKGYLASYPTAEIDKFQPSSLPPVEAVAAQLCKEYISLNRTGSHSHTIYHSGRTI